MTVNIQPQQQISNYLTSEESLTAAPISSMTTLSMVSSIFINFSLFWFKWDKKITKSSKNFRNFTAKPIWSSFPRRKRSNIMTTSISLQSKTDLAQEWKEQNLLWSEYIKLFTENYFIDISIVTRSLHFLRYPTITMKTFFICLFWMAYIHFINYD